MSGMDKNEVELRNTWEYMVDKLLEPFNHPQKGYIAKNKGALSYSKEKINELHNAVLSKSAAIKQTKSLRANNQETTNDVDTEETVGAAVSQANASQASQNNNAVLKTSENVEGSKSDTEETTGAAVSQANASQASQNNDAVKTSENVEGSEEEVKEESSSGWFSYFWSTAKIDEKPLEEEKLSNVESEEWEIPDASLLDTLSWEARYRLGDTVELTAKKVLCILEFEKSTLEDMKIPFNIQRPLLNVNDQEYSQKSEFGSEVNLQEKVNLSKAKDKEVKELKELRAKELGRLKTRLGLFANYAVAAEEKILAGIKKINAQRPGQAAKSPATADAYLKVFIGMCLWAKENADLLLTCLSFEAPPAKNEISKEPLFEQCESMETKFVSYLFRTMFMIELDLKNYEQTQHTRYKRQVPDGEANLLKNRIREIITTLNGNVAIFPGLGRINHVTSAIESVQQVVNTSFANTESRRSYSLVGLVSKTVEEWLPEATPEFIANHSNKFLIKMQKDLIEFHTESSQLKNDVEQHVKSKQMSQQRKTLVPM
jgi:hypothetical protein